MRSWSRLLACSLLSLVGCGAQPASQTATLAMLRPSCDAAHHWDGATCKPRSPIAHDLKAATEAVAAFQVDKAIPLLTQLRQRTPHRHDTLVKIYEQLGIARAYQKQEREALRVFDLLLALSPGHLLSYHLSPQVTFVYERARLAAKRRQVPAVHLSWPRGLSSAAPVPVDVSVVADPKAFLRRAEIHVRRKGTRAYKRVEVPLAKPGAYQRVVLPALATGKPETLQLFLTAFDGEGNEVLRWSSADQPREIPLDFRTPQRWYRKWWVWAIAGGIVATGTGTAVYLIGREPPDTVGGGLGITR